MSFEFDAYVTTALFTPDGAVFALGDGTVRFEGGAVMLRSSCMPGCCLIICFVISSNSAFLPRFCRQIVQKLVLQCMHVACTDDPVILTMFLQPGHFLVIIFDRAASYIIAEYLFDLIAAAIRIVVILQTLEAVVVAATITEDQAFRENAHVRMRGVLVIWTAEDVLAVWSRALLELVLVGLEEGKFLSQKQLL